MPRESLDVPEDLPKQAARQVVLGQLVAGCWTSLTNLAALTLELVGCSFLSQAREGGEPLRESRRLHRSSP